jgi:hypothetical protein
VLEFPRTFQLKTRPGANPIKLFYGCKLRLFIKARAFVPGKPFQPSLMFAGKAGAYSIEAPP